MNFKVRSLVAATLAGSMLMGFGVNAMADSTTDIVNALVAKGVLTEEEGALLTKGRTDEAAGQAKALKKASKLKVSDAIDNATVYGDIRVRAEYRDGKNDAEVKEERQRGRYKLTLGVKTEASDFYTDLALAMGAGGRSDNATFAGAATNGGNEKEDILVKRAMIGYKATDWLTLEAGRIANPLYTTPMVWDGDLTFEGLAEMVKYKVGPADIFLTAVQTQYLGDRKTFTTNGVPGGGTDRATSEVFAFQAGTKFAITDDVNAKAAITYTTYGSKGSTNFKPLRPTDTYAVSTTGTNDLRTLEIPAEINFKLSGNLGVKVYGDYAVNLDGTDRYNAAVAATTAGAARTAIAAAGNDDKAWLLGMELASKSGKSAQKGDWSAAVWYQNVGVYALDQNAVDSDFMDSRVNMKGIVLKTAYNIRDNVVMNFAAGHATRKNDALSTAGAAADIALDLNKYNLYQLDLTYKF